MNMFISDGDRLLAGFSVTGLIVVAYGALLFLALGAEDAGLWFILTSQLVGLTAYAGSMALLPEARADE